ncbi:MAG: hypothetical protein ACD_16C00121G0005 [uncultured bacterium]|nr:MAG: hypothetical protein ACD_16C00121G0005 [uncultured bacterium]
MSYGEADVLEEETDKSTLTERRGMGPDKHTRNGEITSGRSIDHAGTNNNLQRLIRLGTTKLRRDDGLAHEFVRAMRGG